jgi:outer membrane PBP1 activator LpoA protein
MHSAFNTQWSALGGDITAITTLTSELSDNETIANSLATLQSESRIKEIEKAFEAPVDSQARRRTDIDSVVLLSPTPQMAREIRPLLRFHYAGKLPVYAPSTIYQGGSGIANRDLNGIQFVLPASALATDSPRSQPLHALGLDAAALIDHFDQARETGGTLLFGKTGDLSVDTMGNVHRRLKPAVIARGKARAIL